MIDFINYEYDGNFIKEISASELALSYENELQQVILEIMRNELAGIYQFINVEYGDHFNYQKDCVCFSIDNLLVKAETKERNKRAFIFKVYTDNNTDMIRFYGWQLY